MSDDAENAAARWGRMLDATAVLLCGDYPRSIDFYVGKLGFEIVEEGGDPPRFAILRQGGARLFLDSWRGARAPSPRGAWDAYIHVSDVDALAAALADRGVALSRGPETAVYGMREIEIVDPDGAVLCFGQDAPSTP